MENVVRTLNVARIKVRTSFSFEEKQERSDPDRGVSIRGRFISCKSIYSSVMMDGGRGRRGPSCRLEPRESFRKSRKELAYVSRARIPAATLRRHSASPEGKCTRVQLHDAILRALLPGLSGVIRILDSPSAKPHGILKRKTTAESRARSTIVTFDSRSAIPAREIAR